MLRQLSVVAGAAVFAAALIVVFTSSDETGLSSAQATETSAVAPIQVVSANPNYDAGMRIIHVPDAGVAAAYPRQSHRQLNVGPSAAPKAKPQHVAMPKPAQPRRILPPAVVEPKRAVLSAPPPPPNSLTPIRPTPRWRSIEKFTVPPEEKLPAPAEAAPAETSAPFITETIETPVAAAPTETAAVPPADDTPTIDDDSPPPAD